MFTDDLKSISRDIDRLANMLWDKRQYHGRINDARMLASELSERIHKCVTDTKEKPIENQAHVTVFSAIRSRMSGVSAFFQRPVRLRA